LKYEKQLFYHNMITRREVKFEQPIKDGEGFNQRWDISAEIVILYNYLRKFPHKDYSEISWFDKIKKFSQDISWHISLKRRTLNDPTPGQRFPLPKYEDL